MRQPGVRLLSVIRGLFAVVLGSWSLAGLADITQITVESRSARSQSRVPVTFGQAFAVGDVLADAVIAARTAGGAVLPLQLDAKATHADGSLRHAVLTTVLPALGRKKDQQVMLFETDAAPVDADVSMSDLLATTFNATVVLDVGGTIYSASARAALRSGPVQTWLQGPLVSEWLVPAPLETAGGVRHPHLSARFHVRAYVGLKRARVSVTVENNWSLVPDPQDFSYALTVFVDGHGTVLEQENVPHYRQSRWRRVFWWGTEPSIHIAHDRDYLAKTAAVPTYDSDIKVPKSALRGMASEWAGEKSRLMRPGPIHTYMPAGGGRRDIAPLPRWTARYLITQDARAKMLMLGAGEQAGSFDIHYRDRDTDLPISLDTYPDVTGRDNGDFFPACGGSCRSRYAADTSHQPSLSFVPYLVTGDYFHLEELHFWANWNMFYWPVHEGSLGLVVRDQIRGQAWSMRTLGHAAFITPDDHPLKNYFIDKLNNNIDWYDATYADMPPTPLGYVLNPVGSGKSFATWMDDFLTWSIGHLVNLGFDNAREFFEYKARFPVGRMTNPEYCWTLASTYWTRAVDEATGQQFQTWADYKAAVIRSWKENGAGPSIVPPPRAMSASKEDALIAATCDSRQMAKLLGLRRGGMIGGAEYADGYPSNLQPAIAAAVELGISDADQAWAAFNSRSVSPRAPDDYAVNPQWAIVPRSTSPLSDF